MGQFASPEQDALSSSPVVPAAAAGTSWTQALARVVEIAAQHSDDVDQKGRFPAEAVQAMKDGGLLGGAVGPAWGGPGWPLHDIAQMCSQIGGACSSAGMVFAMHHIQLACALQHGQGPWYDDFLRRIVREQLLLGSVTSEVGVGGDIRRSLCAVKTEGDRFELVKHGSVMSYGAYSDALLITARAHDDAPPNGQVLVSVMKDQYTLERTGIWNSLGMRGTCSDAFIVRSAAPTGQIFKVPFADIIANTKLPVSHILWGSTWFGVATNAVHRVRGQMKTIMKANGGSLPPAALKLPDLVARLQLLHSRLQTALQRYEAFLAGGASAIPMSLSTDLTMLKNTMSEGCLAVAQEALGVMGFAGYRNEGPTSLGRHIRDLHSAPLMINNARLVETMSSFLLLDPLNFSLA